jgi:hypothetical protein
MGNIDSEIVNCGSYAQLTGSETETLRNSIRNETSPKISVFLMVVLHCSLVQYLRAMSMKLFLSSGNRVNSLSQSNSDTGLPEALHPMG